MNEHARFLAERRQTIQGLTDAPDMHNAAMAFMARANAHNYSYHFDWLSRPIIQYPQDIVAMQEIIWAVRPDLIIETGIARGGSLIMSASMLALIDCCDAAQAGVAFNPRQSQRRVLGIDIDIRPHNREAVVSHPLSSYIEMIQGSSVGPDVVGRVHEIAKKFHTILVCLDSNHTHDHVIAELEAYAPLVSVGSYCVVFDTIIEDFPAGSFPDRDWDKGNNPKTAVWEYLKRLQQHQKKDLQGSPIRFEIDKTIEQKLLITVAPDGYLKRCA